MGKFFLSPFCLLLLDLVIYFANVWNETEADNTHERRDFSKLSLRPFFHGALQLLLELKKLCNRSWWKKWCQICIPYPQFEFQVILLSATMPQDVLDVTTKFMRNPIRILVKKEELTLEGIKQFFVQVDREVGKCFLLQNCFLEAGSLALPQLLTKLLFTPFFKISIPA